MGTAAAVLVPRPDWTLMAGVVPTLEANWYPQPLRSPESMLDWLKNVLYHATTPLIPSLTLAGSLSSTCISSHRNISHQTHHLDVKIFLLMHQYLRYMHRAVVYTTL